MPSIGTLAFRKLHLSKLLFWRARNDPATPLSSRANHPWYVFQKHRKSYVPSFFLNWELSDAEANGSLSSTVSSVKRSIAGTPGRQNWEDEKRNHNRIEKTIFLTFYAILFMLATEHVFFSPFLYKKMNRSNVLFGWIEKFWWISMNVPDQSDELSIADGNDDQRIINTNGISHSMP